MEYKALIFQNAEGEGPGIFADCLKRRNWGSKVIAFNLGETIPEDWKDYSLLLVMGGFMNVYEESIYPFLREETLVIKQAFRIKLPVMGFCLGAQLMAKALNAKVLRGPVKEIGWYRVSLTAQGQNDILLRLFPRKTTVLQWHGDTFELPDGAVRLFSSTNYPNQAMRIGNMNYGFQFHFEITREMINEWILNSREEIDEMGNNDLGNIIIRDAQRYLPKLHFLAESFFENYLRIIESRQGQ